MLLLAICPLDNKIEFLIEKSHYSNKLMALVLIWHQDSG